jgi:hypothetical protein
MPIRINLLSEIQAEEDLRRRDPVKRAIFVGVLLIALSLVWFSSTWLETKMAMRTKAQVDEQMQAHTNDYNQVQLDLKRIADGQKRLTALQQLNTNRFLQGNLLNAIQKIYVPNVQLIRLRLDQGYVIKEGTPDKANNVGVIAGRPGTSTEKITLTLDARDSSSNPGDQVNRYKELLNRQDFFLKNIQTNGVRLLNLSAPQISLSGKPFVLFSLECRFTDKTR